MDETLNKMTDIWTQMERKTPEQIEMADNFYDKNIMPLVEEDYVRRNQEKVDQEIQYLIISVGASYEPIVLNIKLFEPEKILFLYTNETEKILDKIVGYASLLPSRYEKYKVSPIESAECYQAIKRCYLEWGRPQKICIDFTGGTKAMSSAAAMAGTFMNINVIYVNSTFDSTFKKPIPGSETLCYIANPWSVFGDLKIEKAFSLFGQYAYAGANEKMDEIQKNMSNPIISQQLRYAQLLAHAYEEWDAFNFSHASNAMSELVSILHRDSNNTSYLLMDFVKRLEEQEKILKDLKSIQHYIKNKTYEKILSDNDAYTALMFTMYQCADVREQQKKYDMATLLFYRLLEMVVQKRLYRYHLLASKMDYEKLEIQVEQMPGWEKISKEDRVIRLKDEFTYIKREIFLIDEVELPEKAALLDGLIILSILHDPVTEECSKDIGITEFLNQVRNKVDLRNSSIFAHGFHTISCKRFKKFREFVEKPFLTFCHAESIDFERYWKSIKWINPEESVNYPIR